MIKKFCVMLTVVLGGCVAVGPDYQPQAPDSPANWSEWRSGANTLHGETSTSALKMDWWTLFQDTVLDELEARALQASPDLQTAALRFAQSRVQRQTVAAQYGPDVGLRGSAGRQAQSQSGSNSRMVEVIAPQNSRDAILRSLSQPFNLYQGGFDASWELDLWGRVRRSVEAADANIAGAEASFDGMRLSITSEVARGYFELRAIQAQTDILQRNIQSMTENLRLVQAKARRGLTDTLDVNRQRSELAGLHGELPLLEAQEAALINQLGVLTGARPGQLTTMLTPHQPVFDVLPDLTLGLPSEVARRRPDIRTSEAQLHAATAGIGIAIADLYPRITLGAGFGYETTHGNKFGEWGTRTWSVGPSLSLPVFDMGRRRSVIELRKLEQQEAAVNYQKTVLKAWQEIDDALNAYEAERRRNLKLTEKLRSSTEAYDLAKARYNRGLTDFMTQLDTERVFLQAQSDWTDSVSQLRIKLIAVYKAVGGGDLAGQ